ncbi:hypothetical protein [Cruoricaptor ignavus]|uniref:hypothetical protein n=1 Tax=Cruoricaptor ignavus TaxID=1118202 RepID=UPI001356565E|nr:hypothetical protein [Cruoricaptor ignavus]
MDRFCDDQFILYAVKTSNLGTNYGNEIPGHEYCESISDSIVEPLFECLTCDNVIDWCLLGIGDIEIKQWNAEAVLFLGDQNFSGLKIYGTFRTYADDLYNRQADRGYYAGGGPLVPDTEI